jgi:hypothetical protein
MTPEEAMDQAISVMGIKDPFAKIVVASLMRDLEQYGDKMPAPGSEHERKVMELGAIVWKEISR